MKDVKSTQQNHISQLELVQVLLKNRGLYSLLKQIFQSEQIDAHSINKNGVYETTLRFKGELKERLRRKELPESIQIDFKTNKLKNWISNVEIVIRGRNTAQVKAAFNEARSVYAVRHQEEDLKKKAEMA